MMDRSNATRQAVEQQLTDAPPELRDFFEQELKLAMSALDTAHSIEVLAAALHAACQRVERQLESTPPIAPLACRSGCSFCCRGTRVEVLAPEALAIAHHLRSMLATRAESTTSLTERLGSVGHEARELSNWQRFRAQTPCVFLEPSGATCTIYEVRPVVCHLHHSLDRARCERAVSDPDTSIPRHATVEALYGLAQAAFVVGCEERGLEARPLELAGAVSIALETRDAAERWAEGESVFDAAAHAAPDEYAEYAEYAEQAGHRPELIAVDRLLRK